jgi:hypothetical protein
LLADEELHGSHASDDDDNPDESMEPLGMNQDSQGRRSGRLHSVGKELAKKPEGKKLNMMIPSIDFERFWSL